MVTPSLNLTLDANLTELVSSCDEEEGLILEVATGNEALIFLLP